MGIRKPAPWMQPADDRILEYLEQAQADTPKGISESEEINLSKGTIRNRVRVLHKNGLIDRIQRGVYTLSGKGQEYLVGAADLREEPEPE